MTRGNGGCNCSDPTCHADPELPTDHAPRLEADGDIWPSAT